MTTLTTGKATDFIQFSRASNATVVDSDGKIKWAPHNLLLASESFDASAWTKVGVTVSANSVAAPNGSTTADAIITTAVGGAHRAQQTVSVPENGTFSAWVKPNGYNWVLLQVVSGSAGCGYWFDVSTGAVGTANAFGSGFTASSPLVSAYGNGWYLCKFDYTSNGTGTNANVIVANADNVSSFTGNGSSGLYLWGAHLYRSDLGGMQANTSAYPMYNPTTPKNLLGYTEDFSNAAWTKSNATISANSSVSPYGILTADTLTSTAVNSLVGAFSLPLTTGGQTFSLFVKQGTAANATIVFETGGLVNTARATYNFATQSFTTTTSGSGFTIISASSQAVSDGWLRISFSISLASAATGSIRVYPGLYASTTVGETVVIWGAQLSDSASLDSYVPVYGAAVTSAAYYGPRRDFDPVTLACKGLLVEEQRTNLAIRSQEFNTGWSASGVTITADALLSPDRTVNADKIIPDVGISSGSITLIPTLAANTAYTWSVFAKKGEWSWLRLLLQDENATPLSVWFNLDSGLVGTVQAGATATIVNYGDGWYRCSITRTTGATTSAPRNRIYATNGDNASTTGDGTSGIYIWGAQLEAGSFATSYIPTGAATATRSADVASVSTQAFPYSASEGTVVAKYSSFMPTASGQNVVNLSDGTANERLFVDHSSGIRGYMTTGGVAQAIITLGTYVAGNTYNVALAAMANSVQMALDGVLGTEDTSATMPTVNKMNIGSGNTGVSQLNGHIRQITYLPRRISNTELQTRTA